MTVYPAQIDTSLTLPAVIDNQTPVSAAVFNKLRTTIIAVEAELGVKPSGIHGTVRARLDALEVAINTINSITLNQDLGGTTVAPLVIGIQGRPVSPNAPAINDVLLWDGISWTPSPAPAAALPNVRVATSSPVTVLITDYLIKINLTVAGATTVNLPNSPGVGQIVVIKDDKGDANTNNITINIGSGQTIDGFTSYVIDQSYGALSIMYQNNKWSII